MSALPLASRRIISLCVLLLGVVVSPGIVWPAESEPETLYLFYAPSCPHCNAVLRLADKLGRDHGTPVERIDLADPTNVERLADMYTQHGVPPEEWGGTIAAFYGDRWWNDPDVILDQLEEAVREGVASLSSPRAAAGGARLRSMAASMGALTVATAGLIDGINPCAITALIFLVAYLGHLGRSRMQILGTGVVFSAGVFGAYLAVGLGTIAALGMSGVVSRVSYWLFPVVAAGCILLALWNVYDFAKVRRGGADDATLRLPRRLVQAQHLIVRSLSRSRAWVAVALVAGVLISLMELLCTGQIYLPTIMFMWSTPDLRARGLQLLVLYVFMFTVPLLAITGAAYLGYGSEAMAGLVRRHTGKIKIAMALILFFFAAYLLALWRGLL